MNEGLEQHFHKRISKETISIFKRINVINDQENAHYNHDEIWLPTYWMVQLQETHNANFGHLNGSALLLHTSGGGVNWHTFAKLLAVVSISKCLNSLWPSNSCAAETCTRMFIKHNSQHLKIENNHH